MRVLWICQTVPPEADALIGGDKELKKTGGWILGMAAELIKIKDLELAIASVSPLVDGLKVLQGEHVKYFVAPSVKSVKDKKLEQNWKVVNSEYKPDVVHIHGTEYNHALSWVYANGAENVVVSLQGIMSAYYYYYYYGISQWDVLKNITPRDLYRETVFGGARRFARIAKSEQELLRKVNHVIGRTDWDKNQLWAINPEAHYHFNNEVLRKEFYDGSVWNYKSCNKFTIFVNQAEAPYKGIHQLIKALPLIIREFPQVRIRVAGFNPCDTSFRRRLMRTGYGRFLNKLMKKYAVTEYIEFIGPQNAEAMKQELLKANVFVLPSSIENSSNALGEAQMLGAPCVASRVGGMATMIPDPKCGFLYRFSDIAELAYSICEALRESEHFDNSEMRKVASERHNGATNSKALVEIYNSIIL